MCRIIIMLANKLSRHNIPDQHRFGRDLIRLFKTLLGSLLRSGEKDQCRPTFHVCCCSDQSCMKSTFRVFDLAPQQHCIGDVVLNVLLDGSVSLKLLCLNYFARQY